jgi:hypothetical protein
MPPGLKSQIAFAVIVTLGAVLVLPSALSAHSGARGTGNTSGKSASAGTVATSVKTFKVANFSASSFSDWER